MSIPTGPDPIDRLRAADPIHADDVPDASLARVTARIQEHIMTTQKNDPTVRHPRGHCLRRVDERGMDLDWTALRVGDACTS